MTEKNVRVGIGVLLENSYNQILLGKRIDNHGKNSWSICGGHLEFGETLEQCAIREVQEEIGITIETPKFLGITNDLFAQDQKHYISIFMKAIFPQNQTIINLEPHKNIDWQWFDRDKMPENLFLPFRKFIQGEFYFA